MTKIENLRTRLNRAKKHGLGLTLFVTTNSEQVSEKVSDAISGHPNIQYLSFPDEKSLRKGHGVLKDTQFETQEKGVLQVIQMPEELYLKALRGELGEDILKDISDAFTRRMGIVDEE